MNRAADLRHMLAGARHPGESFKAYRNRRVLGQVSVDKHLRGRIAFESTRFVEIPEKGKDPQTEAAILRGQLRDVQIARGKRVARTKGKTFRKEAA